MAMVSKFGCSVGNMLLSVSIVSAMENSELHEVWSPIVYSKRWPQTRHQRGNGFRFSSCCVSLRSVVPS